MSLLAYCYYMSQDFSNAAKVYEQLAKYYPEVPDYKLYLA
jgi:tetratricopeptide repeat protein 30